MTGTEILDSMISEREAEQAEARATRLLSRDKTDRMIAVATIAVRAVYEAAAAGNVRCKAAAAEIEKALK